MGCSRPYSWGAVIIPTCIQRKNFLFECKLVLFVSRSVSEPSLRQQSNGRQCLGVGVGVGIGVGGGGVGVGADGDVGAEVAIGVEVGWPIAVEVDDGVTVGLCLGVVAPGV